MRVCRTFMGPCRLSVSTKARSLLKAFEGWVRELDIALRDRKCVNIALASALFYYSSFSRYKQHCQAYIYLAPWHVLLPQQPAPPPRLMPPRPSNEVIPWLSPVGCPTMHSNLTSACSRSAQELLARSTQERLKLCKSPLEKHITDGARLFFKEPKLGGQPPAENSSNAEQCEHVAPVPKLKLMVSGVFCSA